MINVWHLNNLILKLCMSRKAVMIWWVLERDLGVQEFCFFRPVPDLCFVGFHPNVALSTKRTDDCDGGTICASLVKHGELARRYSRPILLPPISL